MLKILLMEDEDTIGNLVIDVLNKQGYSVDWAKDGEEGLQLYYQKDYDLLLLDVTMPKIDGLEACKTIRKKPFGFMKPIIILSVMTSLKDKIKGLALGADEYLPKPFYTENVISRIPIVIDYKKEKLSDSHLVELPSFTKLSERYPEILAKDMFLVYTDISNYYDRITEYTNEFMLLLKNFSKILEKHIAKENLFHLDGPNFCFFIDKKSAKKTIKNILAQFKKETSNILKNRTFTSFNHMVMLDMANRPEKELLDIGPVIQDLLSKLTRPGNYALSDKLKILVKN